MGVSRKQGWSLQPQGEHFVLSYKRADRGNFRVPEPPRPDATSVQLSERELDDLLDGIALSAEVAAPRTRRTRVH